MKNWILTRRREDQNILTPKKREVENLDVSKSVNTWKEYKRHKYEKSKNYSSSVFRLIYLYVVFILGIETLKKFQKNQVCSKEIEILFLNYSS